MSTNKCINYIHTYRCKCNQTVFKKKYCAVINVNVRVRVSAWFNTLFLLLKPKRCNDYIISQI